MQRHQVLPSLKSFGRVTASIQPSRRTVPTCSAAKLHECCCNGRCTFEVAIQASARAVFNSKFTDNADTLFGFARPCWTPNTHLAVKSWDSIVCTLTSKWHKYLQSQQVWFNRILGAELQPHPSDPSFLLVDHTAGGGGEIPSNPNPNPSGPAQTEVGANSTAEQVLEHFRDRFIEDMDVNMVVFGLEHANIISDGDRKTITGNLYARQQNEFLHVRLKETCSKEALMVVCDMLIGVKGHSKMNELGKEMKCLFEKGTGNLRQATAVTT